MLEVGRTMISTANTFTPKALDCKAGIGMIPLGILESTWHVQEIGSPINLELDHCRGHNLRPPAAVVA
jgi:hypothetical protein